MMLILTSALVVALIVYLARATRREAEPPVLLHWLTPGETGCHLLPSGQVVAAPVDELWAPAPVASDRPAGVRNWQTRGLAR